MSWDPTLVEIWKKLIQKIKLLFPRYKIIIQRRKLKMYYGRINKVDKKVLIFIDKDLPFDLSIYTLAEELAHLKAGLHGSFSSDHNSKWGIWYSYFIRTLFKLIDRIEKESKLCKSTN